MDLGLGFDSFVAMGGLGRNLVWWWFLGESLAQLLGGVDGDGALGVMFVLGSVAIEALL